MDPRSLSSRYQPYLDDQLRAIVGNSLLPLYHMMRYHLGWTDAQGDPKESKGGKMLRPGLCLLASESVGADWKRALPAAAALELVHNFSLIHDDIEDNDRERRGVPTVWSIWGLAQGINAGDAMHTVARLALLGLEEKGIAPDRILKAAHLLDATCLRLCEGQYLDISFEDRMDIGVEDYLAMIAGKTAALFACSIKLGALLGTDDQRIINALSEFGRNVGMAFQIQDDVLGIWGQSKTTGKSTASDILKKKKTMPVLYGLEQANADQKSTLLQIYAQKVVTETDVPRVLEILESTGARSYSENQAAAYFAKALSELESTAIPDSAKNDFRELSQALVHRQY